MPGQGINQTGSASRLAVVLYLCGEKKAPYAQGALKLI